MYTKYLPSLPANRYINLRDSLLVPFLPNIPPNVWTNKDITAFLYVGVKAVFVVAWKVGQTILVYVIYEKYL